MTEAIVEEIEKSQIFNKCIIITQMKIVHLLLYSKKTPLVLGNSIAKDNGEAVMIKASIQKWSNNNIVKDDTTSSISKINPFGGGHLMIEAFAEAVRIQANIQPAQHMIKVTNDKKTKHLPPETSKLYPTFTSSR